MKRIIGKAIGNYRITEEIGSGGMGRVYKAIHLALDRVVAIKMIHPHLVGDPGVVNRFYREAKIQARLNHPNIVTVYDFLEIESGCFIVMEYVHGESLGKVLSKQGAFETHIAIPIFRQILDGIRYAHLKGVIHMDIKPNNFILTPRFVKTTDFGIAQIICDTGLNAGKAAVGTPKYMSPEQILGEKTDHRTDIYSLGVTLYEMLTGRLPFNSDSGSDLEIRRGHIELPPLLPSSIRPEVSGEIEKAILKALSKRPEDRFQSIDEFILAIEKVEKDKRDALPSLDAYGVVLDKGRGRKEEFDETGDLSKNPYPKLLLSIHREKRSGVLTLDSNIRLKIYFLDGIIVFVEGEEPRLALGEILVHKAKITEAEKENVLSFAHDTGLKIGEALIRLGKITPHELSSTLEAQLKEKLISGFMCESGSYGFKNTANFRIEAVYRIDPIQVIYEGVNRFVRNGEIPNNLFYDLNSSIVPIPSIKEELKRVVFKSPKELKLVDLLRGEITLREAISASPLNSSDTLRFLYFLVLVELAEIRRGNAVFKDVRSDKRDRPPNHDETRIMTDQEIETLHKRVFLRERPRRH